VTGSLGGVNRRELKVLLVRVDKQCVYRRLITVFLLAASVLLAEPSATYLEQQTRLQNARVSGLSEQRLKHSRRIWLMSIPVLVAGNALDARSSWGRPETNGLLQGAGGQFNGRGAAIKFSITGALLASQFVMVRAFRHDHEAQDTVLKGWTSSNLIFGSAAAGIAWHNYRIH
jgi:hypothetical protein